MKAWIQLAKYGDIVNILPVMNQEFQRIGQPPHLVVARDYADILKDVDYVEPVLFDGHWQDLRGAIRFAKQNYNQVECFQLYGIGMEFEKRRPSFQLDQWDRTGYLDQWDALPLRLPREESSRPGKPTIAISDHSQSSPFFQKEELVAQVSGLFPDHTINRISGKRYRNPIGVLPEFDAADLVICVDSSHLHISKATTTPVIALIADRPTFWHGSAWSRRYAFHCRYCDYTMRKDELAQAALAAVSKRPIRQPVVYQTARPHGYNPSVLRVNNSDLLAYRYHPDKGWKTRLAIESGGGVSDIIFPDELKDCSVEDGRLFLLNGKPHMAYVCARAEYGIFRSIQAYGPLEHVDGAWRITKHLVPKVRGNDFSGMQKNWVPVVSGGKLWFIWGVSDGQQTSLQVDGDRVVSTVKCDAPAWDYGDIRGGCVTEIGGRTVRFFHSRTGVGHTHYRFRYYVGSLLMNPQPPFNALAVTKTPLLAGNEKYSDCPHWKPNVAIPYGAKSSGDSAEVHVGLNDCECAMLKVTAP